MFYDRVNELCKQRNTTISVFTREILGLNSSSATGWKKGASPSSDVVVKAARYFGVASDFLLGLDSFLAQDRLSLTDEETQLIKELRSSDDTAREAAIAAMHSVLAALSKSGKAAVYYNSGLEDAENKGSA